MSKHIRHIGIDPGVNTGIAIWDSRHKALHLDTVPFWKAIQIITEQMQLCREKEIVFKAVLEDPNENKPVFTKKGADNVRKTLKVAQNVGSNKRDAQLIKEFLILHNIETTIVKPTSAKWKKDFFLKLTGYEGHVSQHAIDAARLVYGK